MAEPACAEAQAVRVPDAVRVRGWGSASDVAYDAAQARTHRITPLAGECLRWIGRQDGQQAGLLAVLHSFADVASAEDTMATCLALLRLGLLEAAPHNAADARDGVHLPSH